MEKLARILFPFKHVCGSVWKNDEGQLSFLRFAVCASPEVFTFCTFISNLNSFYQETSLGRESKASNLKQIDQETSVETERNQVDLKQDDRRCMECSEPITDDDKALPFELPLCGPIHTRCLHKFSF
jgi:hypothetical protein